MKKKYEAPTLECYGPISNFTTGGSSKKSEWKWESGSSSMMGMGGSAGEWVKTSNSKKKNSAYP
ncbi:MAG: hypothetical protein HOI66_15660 [Verrucomicrobia bacterium]|nr:hypothetical protein [Verrucomicrobiota bacterium]MDA7644847.1 hypothetical protein [bacterium]